MSAPGPVHTTHDVVESLKAACKAAGGQKAWAISQGLSPQHIHDVIHGRRLPGDSVLRGLDLQRGEPTYVPRQPREIALHDEHGVTIATAWAS